MCVNTQNPDHVMARSPCSLPVTFKVNNTHLIGQQNAHSSEMSLEIVFGRLHINHVLPAKGCFLRVFKELRLVITNYFIYWFSVSLTAI